MAACFLFELQRPIVSLAAGVVGYDVTIRSLVGRQTGVRGQEGELALSARIDLCCHRRPSARLFCPSKRLPQFTQG